MSKKLYLGLYAGSLVAGIVFGILLLIVGGIGANFKAQEQVAPILAILMFLAGISILAWVIIHTIFYFLILGKMWGAIQDGYTEVTVGKAIGFLFIPFFNLYWIFKVWGGFPNEYNSFIARNNLPVPPISNGVFIALPITVLLSAFYIGLLALPFVMIAVIIKASDAVNAINNAPIYSTNHLFNPPPPPRRF
jgi:hypothetical protein